MAEGVVESLKRDRTGFKVDGKWFGGDAQLKLNQGDTIEWELDPSDRDSYGNAKLASVTVLKKAQNPFKGGGNAGTTAPPFRQKEYTPRPQDPDVQSRIARSHAVTTAVAILGPKGKLPDYLALAEKVKSYTETGALPSAKPEKGNQEGYDDLEF